ASPGRVVVVATHDERMIPLADRVVELSPRVDRESRPPERRELQPGDVLFAQGEPGDLVYVVEEGEIELVRQLTGGGEEFVAVVCGGVGLAELAGARRTEEAYPHLADASNAADVLVVGQSQFLFVGNVDLNAVDRLPEVATTSRIAVYLLFAGRTESGRLLGPTDMFPIAHGDAGLGNTIERWKMLAGRPANPERVDEATASFLLAERLHLRVGATLRLRFTRAGSFGRVAAELLGGFTRRLQVANGAAPVIEQVADGPLVTVKIVGIEA